MRHRRAARLGWVAAPLAVPGLVLHAAGVMALSMFGPPPPWPVPDWAPLALPLAVYTGLAVLAVHRFAIAPIAGTFATACLLHAVFIVLPGVAVPALATLAGVSGVTPPAWSSTALTLLSVLSVTLTLAPFRRLVAPRPRYTRSTSRAGYPGPRLQRVVVEARAPLPDVARPAAAAATSSLGAPPGVPPAPVKPSLPRPGAVTPPPAMTLPSVVIPPLVVPPPPLPAPAPVATPTVGLPTPPPLPPPPTIRAPASAPSRSTGRPPGAEPMEEMVRIAFARVADQLPADLFKLPHDRLGANLLEAGFLLVPRRLVVPQLAEGIVQVTWDVVADQFPSQALAVPETQIAARIPNGAIALPLDEIIRQLPPDLFTLTTPEVDVRGLEDFPPPFQPHVPPPSASRLEPHVGDPPVGEAPVDDTDGTAVEQDSGTEEPMVTTGSSWDETLPPAAAPEAGDEPVTIAEPEWSEPPFVTEAPPESEPEALLAFEPEARLAPEPEAPDEPEQEDESERVETAAVERLDAWEPVDDEPPSAVEPIESVATFTPVGEAAREAPFAPAVEVAREAPFAPVAALLAPLMAPLATGSIARGRRTVLTVLPPAMDQAAAVDTALPVLHFLVDPRLASTATQATIRTRAAALVATPLAPGNPEGTVLLAATSAGSSLALLERLSLRAARDGHAASASRSPGHSPRSTVDDDALRPAVVPPHVRAMAESLQAFGAVSPSVLRDPRGSLFIYLFLPRGLDPSPLASLARDLTRALAQAPLGPVESVVVRSVADGRLMVRILETTTDHVTVLVAGGGPVSRPGLARIELDRAAARLGAS